MAEQSNFGTTLTSYLRGKASKAYEFGEGLVMSITSKDRRTLDEEEYLEEVGIPRDDSHPMSTRQEAEIPPTSSFRVPLTPKHRRKHTMSA